MKISIGTYSALTANITSEVTQNIQEEVHSIVSEQVESTVQEQIDNFAEEITTDLSDIHETLKKKADLTSTGKLYTDQLPLDYLDEHFSDFEDVVRFDGVSSFPSQGDEGIIYVDSATGLTYTWSGTDYQRTWQDPETIESSEIADIFNDSEEGIDSQSIKGLFN